MSHVIKFIHKQKKKKTKAPLCCLWSLIGHSDKTSTAAGDSPSGKREKSGAYKIEGVIYYVKFKWLTVVIIAVIHSADDSASGGEMLGQPHTDAGGGMPDIQDW